MWRFQVEFALHKYTTVVRETIETHFNQTAVATPLRTSILVKRGLRVAVAIKNEVVTKRMIADGAFR